MWVIEYNGEFQYTLVNPRSFRDVNGIRHGHTVFDLWSEDELNTIEVYIVNVDPIPSGYVLDNDLPDGEISEELIKEEGGYHLVRKLMELPPVALSAEELYDILKAKGVLIDTDRPRAKP